MRRSALCRTWVALMAVSACGDSATAPNPVATFAPVVSNVIGGGGAASRGAVTPDLSALDPVAFVSLEPGAIPEGLTGSIRDLQNGALRTVTLVDGGFDPVAIPAAAGDTLEIAIALSGGGLAFAKAVVPIRQPPRVVRTSPAKGRTDVAINATVAVIFSEPVDLTTLTSKSLRLLKGTEPAPGVIRPDPTSAVGVELVPARPLTSGAAYQLVLTNAIADRTGDRLDGSLTSEFQTETSSIEQLTLTFASQPANGFAGDPMWVQVSAQNSLHILNTGFTGQVTLLLHTWSNSPEGGVSTSQRELATVTAVGGQATFADLTLPTPGTYRLEVTAPRLNAGMGEVFGTYESEWVAKTAFPTPRYNVGGGVLDGLIYVVGGQYAGWSDDAPPVQATVEAYDPATNTWRTRAPMPTARYGVQVAVMNGLLYAVGGQSGSMVASAAVEAYDPSSNSWTTRAPLPHPSVAMGVAAVGGILYAIGGADASAAGSTVDAYDPVTNAWTPRASPPGPLPGAGAAALDGLIYVVSGNDSLLDGYSPATDTWTVLPPLPSGLPTTCVASHAGQLYVKTPTGQAHYEPASGTWSAHDAYPGSPSWCDGFMASNGNVLFMTYFGQVWAYRP